MSFPIDREDWGWAILWFVVVFYQFYPAFVGSSGRNTRKIYTMYSKFIWGAPPAWLFGVVWPILYVLMALGAWLVHRDTSLEQNSRLDYNLALLFALLSVLFNKMWMPVFTGMMRFGLALGVIVVTLGTAVAFVVITAIHERWTPMAFWLIYAAWLVYAAYLNAMYIKYNKCVSRIACELRKCEEAEMKACIERAGLTQRV